jgi:hypothetical protein
MKTPEEIAREIAKDILDTFRAWDEDHITKAIQKAIEAERALRGRVSDEEIDRLAVCWAVAESKTNTKCPACAEDVLWTHVASDFKAGFNAALYNTLTVPQVVREALLEFVQPDNPAAIDWKWWAKEFGESPGAMAQMLAHCVKHGRQALAALDGNPPQAKDD